jgi:hypothetical protein
LKDAERLIIAWNERQAQRMPKLFSPTFCAAAAARFWFLWVKCPACRTTLSCRSRLSKACIADEMRIDHARRVLGE